MKTKFSKALCSLSRFDFWVVRAGIISGCLPFDAAFMDSFDRFFFPIPFFLNLWLNLNSYFMRYSVTCRFTTVRMKWMNCFGLTRQHFTDFPRLSWWKTALHYLANKVERYREMLAVRYFFKPNSDWTDRNYGAERSSGDYLIIWTWCYSARRILRVERGTGKWAGRCLASRPRPRIFYRHPESHQLFDDVVFYHRRYPRRERRHVNSYPRSFNKGIRTGSLPGVGRFFPGCVSGEDIDFSIRIFSGLCLSPFPDAWVYHKRRTDLKKFFKQVHNSGIARINLYKKYPEAQTCTSSSGFVYLNA